AVVVNWSYVLDGANFKSSRVQRTDGRFASGAGAVDADFQHTDTMFAGLVGGGHGRLLRGKRSALTRPTEAERTSALPGERPALAISNGDNGVVEGGLDVSNPMRDVLALLLLKNLLFAFGAGSCRAACWFCHSSFPLDCWRTIVHARRSAMWFSALATSC